MFVDCCAAVFLRDQFFDFPHVGFCADGEFEIFFCDGVPVLFSRQFLAEMIGVLKPYLVDHHNTKKVTNRSEE